MHIASWSSNSGCFRHRLLSMPVPRAWRVDVRSGSLFAEAKTKKAETAPKAAPQKRFQKQQREDGSVWAKVRASWVFGELAGGEGLVVMLPGKGLQIACEVSSATCPSSYSEGSFRSQAGSCWTPSPARRAPARPRAPTTRTRVREPSARARSKQARRGPIIPEPREFSPL